MRASWPRPSAVDLLLPLLGGLAILVAAFLSTRLGSGTSIVFVVAVAAFGAMVTAFVVTPHLAVAGAVLLFALLPTLKVLTTPEIGVVKDVVVVAAVLAAAIVSTIERRPIDHWVLGLVLLLLGMYAINLGGGYDIAWAQGVRLVGEPLLLLLVGLTLSEPRRTFRFAMGALVATACLVATWGILQQFVGPNTLIGLGYAFDEQVRTLPGGQFRSFGTLDDPFVYATLLSFGIAGVIFWLRRGPLASTAALLLLLSGLGMSFVRTAILFVVGLFGLALARWGYVATSVLVAAATMIAGGVAIVTTSGTELRTYAVSDGAGPIEGSVNVILNGRVSAWKVALGPDPADLVLGRGVGEVGTAAERATYTVAPSSDTATTQASAVDSGYLATVADIGFVGLAVLLALYGRLVALSVAAARRRRDAGWVALGLLLVMLVDALSRSSFTGFPTAFLALLLVGTALAAAREEGGPSPRPTAAAGR